MGIFGIKKFNPLKTGKAGVLGIEKEIDKKIEDEAKKKKGLEIMADLAKVLSFMKMSKVKVRFLILSIILSLGLTLFSMYTVSLLFPLSQGIIQGNFDNVKRLAVVGSIIAKFSGFFKNSSPKIFLLLVFWLYLTIIIKNALQYGAGLSAQYQAKVSTIKLRDLLLEKCLSFGKNFYDQNTVAYIHSVLTRSTDAIENLFDILQQFIIQILLLLVYLGIMVFISWRLTIISIIIFPLISLFTKKVIKKIKEISKEYDRNSINLSNKVLSILYCMPLIMGYGKEDKEKEDFAKASQLQIESAFKIQKITSLMSPIQDIGTTTGILLVAVGMAWVMGFDHSLTASRVLVFFFLAMKIIPGLNTLNNFKLGIATATGSIKQIDFILLENSLFLVKDGTKKFTGLQKEIEFRNLNFSYNSDEKFSLQDISFSIEKGKTTAIVGPTGSGKSTLASLVLRFYDCPPNSIFVDGQDIKDYNIKSLRSYMSFVSQEDFLFNDTIKYNICYGHEGEVPEEKYRNIIKRTFINNFANNLPKKTNTIVGERGTKLSGGEKQRIAIARALIKEPEILIMDEATSALDSQTEAKISKLIGEVTKGKTVLIIAHRLSTIRNADKIIYLDNGKILESGTFKELTEKKGFFTKQLRAQKI